MGEGFKPELVNFHLLRRGTANHSGAIVSSTSGIDEDLLKFILYETAMVFIYQMFSMKI